jgi:2'-5' RNA ligase
MDRRYPASAQPSVGGPQLSLFDPSRPLREEMRRAPIRRGPVWQRADRVVHFFAVLPPEEIRSDLTRLRLQTIERERIVGRPVPSERLHISIARLCDCAPADLPKLMKSTACLADEIASRVTMPRFDVSFDRLQTFINVDKKTRERKSLLVLCDGSPSQVSRFYALFRASFARRGVPLPKVFNPHLTLYYGNRPIAPRDVAPLRWTVQEFVLVQSFHGQSKHVILKRWPLVEPREIR